MSQGEDLAVTGSPFNPTAEIVGISQGSNLLSPVSDNANSGITGGLQRAEERNRNAPANDSCTWSRTAPKHPDIPVCAHDWSIEITVTVKGHFWEVLLWYCILVILLVSEPALILY
jgi:hypothetical protein